MARAAATVLISLVTTAAGLAAYHFLAPPRERGEAPAPSASGVDGRLARLESRLAALEFRVPAPSLAAAPPAPGSPKPAPGGPAAAGPAPTEAEIATFRAIYDEVRRREAHEQEMSRMRAVLERLALALDDEKREAAVTRLVAYSQAVRDAQRDLGASIATKEGRDALEAKREELRRDLEHDLRATLPGDAATRILESVPGIRQGPRWGPMPPLTGEMGR